MPVRFADRTQVSPGVESRRIPTPQNFLERRGPRVDFEENGRASGR